MSGWNYVAVKHVDKDGEAYYGLHEQYNLPTGKVWTEDEVAIQSDSPKSLAHWLRLAADDVEKYEPIEEDK